MRINLLGISLTVGFVLLATAPILLNTPELFASSPIQETTNSSDLQIQADLARALNNDRFKEVDFSVKDGVITLKGTVSLFVDKETAAKKAFHARQALAIRNEIRVAPGKLSDLELQAKLVKKIQYDRVGYGTTAFNAISVGVRDGVVTLSGHAYGPTDKSSALAAAGYMPGVQDLIDDIQVDPTSAMDDRIRLEVARLIYGYPSLSRYAIDPGKPIRISVQNGNVTLYGTVDNQADRDTAGIRANGASGAFKVTNALEVEGTLSERE
jgi:osmotically-inducible protein OsmY